MNPTEIVARIRSIVLRLGLIVGGIVLALELWRWLVSPGADESEVLSFSGFSIKNLFTGLWPDGWGDIWLVERVSDWLFGLPFFLAVPVGALILVAVIYFGYTRVVVPVFHFLARIFALVTRYGTKQRRHIVICTDGTWNFPEELEGGIIKSSNVYKFWDNLKGKRMKLVELTCGADLVKHHKCADGTVQVGLYYPGVGNPATYSSLGGIIGGAFGFGAKSIVREAFRDVIRYYHPGDKITVVGFSRGAAIARWIASTIETQGVPRLTISDTAAGKLVVGLLRALLPDSAGWAQKRDVRVDFLGVWDTVASFGLAKNVLGIPFQRINLFTDFNVSSAVRRVVHLVAVDEQRDAFLPTLVEPPKAGKHSDTIIEEVWFPGVHSNVGGGFLGDKLAKISLDYMTRRFRDHYAADQVPVELETTDFGRLEENITSPLRPSSGPIYEMVPRRLPDKAVLHESVFKKMALTARPRVNPDGPEDLAYTPPNVAALMDRLAKRKEESAADLARLAEQGLIGDAERARAEAALAEACRLKVVS